MKKWLETLEAHLIKWLLGVFTTSIGVAVVFYFNATHTMAQQTNDIKELKVEIKKIDNAPTLNTLKINQLNSDIKEQKSDLKDIKKEFQEFQRQYNLDQKKILELLIEIKQNER